MLHFLMFMLQKTASSSNFIFVNEMKIWKEAQSFCREHHTDLASVRNHAENEQIRMMLSQNQHTWIGLNRKSWSWTDGRFNPFTHWHTNNNEPNGDLSSTCVLIHQNQWEDRPCDTTLYFVCKQGEDKTTNQSNINSLTVFLFRTSVNSRAAHFILKCIFP